MKLSSATILLIERVLDSSQIAVLGKMYVTLASCMSVWALMKNDISERTNIKSL